MAGQTAIVIDGSRNEGGAVRVVLEAARALNADIYIGFSPNPQWWHDHAPHDATILGGVPRLLPRDLAAARRIHQLDLSEYETVLTTGPPAKFYHPSDGQRWLHYTNHPSIPYSLQHHGRLLKYPLHALDKLETRCVPELIANSRLTAQRVATNYNRHVDAVINPPVDVTEFTSREGDGSFVMVGRVCNRKRTELAVGAFAATNHQLHVVGDGPLRETLDANAPDNITFHGYLDRDELIARVEASSYGVFLSQREDFGITPIEYQAAGLPVLAVDEPNTNNQITDHHAGRVVDPTHDAVATTATSMTARDWDRDRIAAAVQEYSTSQFHETLHAFLDRDGQPQDARRALHGEQPDREAVHA